MDIAGLFTLKGRTALVTGGSRGIGRMIAAGFLAAGARVYVTGRKARACEAAAAELGPGCLPLPADIATVEGCEYLARTLAGSESGLDILVNNAGAAWGAEFDDFPEHGWDKVMDINVKSPFFLTQQLLPLLLSAARRDGGPAKVINIASVDGQRVSPWETYSYQASKAALIHLTRRMAARLAPEGIHVTALAPGAFGTDMNQAARDHADKVSAAIPAGRIGRPEDIAAAAVYLASRAGDYVVGSTLTVDGGLVHASFGPGIDGEG
ncbi:SDR family oxidoreductase [Niveispirillum fermenti]|uniref:SDR family oxidoreductase n=1 Tax=Niveispirillum fermenti TaxID=1233113 RepID=UPI003A88D571